jgi:hypothetical protein
MRLMESVLSALFLAIATLLLLSVHIVNAAPTQQRPKQSHTDRKSAQRTLKEQVIVGTIEWEYKPLAWDCDTPNCDHFALYDPESGINYDLDNSLLASRYEGKKVRLTGIVDTKNDAIHVISIEEIK